MKKISLLLLISIFPFLGSSQEIDANRPEKVNALMSAVGNIDSWKNAKGFYMLEIAHYKSLNLPLVRHFWIDFETPRIKIKSRSAERHEDRALNNKMGWTLEKGELSLWEESTVNGFRSFWPGIPTRIFHLLANNDPSLTYEVDDDRINFSVDGQFVVWIATDPEGNPVAYGRSDNHAETHFLGEMIAYGPTRLWKEAYEPGGQWKVTMVDYKLLDDLSNISFDAPKNQ